MLMKQHYQEHWRVERNINMNVIGKFTDETQETIKEVAEDIKDEVGQMVEQGIQSITGTQLTPQQIQQKQVNDQKKIMEARRKLTFYQQTAQAQTQVRQQEKQKQMQKQQMETQEEQTKKVEKIQQQQDPKAPGAGTPEAVLRSQAERKAGKGLGG